MIIQRIEKDLLNSTWVYFIEFCYISSIFLFMNIYLFLMSQSCILLNQSMPISILFLLHTQIPSKKQDIYIYIYIFILVDKRQQSCSLKQKSSILNFVKPSQKPAKIPWISVNVIYVFRGGSQVTFFQNSCVKNYEFYFFIKSYSEIYYNHIWLTRFYKKDFISYTCSEQINQKNDISCWQPNKNKFEWNQDYFMLFANYIIPRLFLRTKF